MFDLSFLYTDVPDSEKVVTDYQCKNLEVNNHIRRHVFVIWTASFQNVMCGIKNPYCLMR